MAKKGKNKLLWLECTECGNKNYSTFHSRETQTKEKKGKLELNKHCKHCRRHTPHKESK